MGNAREFQVELSKEWAAKLREVKGAVESVGLEALSRVVQKSPVHTGRFKGNWALSIETPYLATTEQIDPGGGATIAAGEAVLARYPDGEWPVIYVQNNLPYAVPLEDGHSKQAPGGMVALTVAELQTMFEGDI